MSQAPNNLLALAIDKGAGIDEITKLVELAERMEDRQSERAYYVALSQFQKNCPEIKRNKKADFGQTTGGKTGAKYSYAPLDSIVSKIKAPLADAGLSYRFEEPALRDNLFGVICIVSHVGGHSTSVVMYAPADNSGGKSSIQQIGSTMTYLRRYTMTGILGITTGDEDDDGKSADAPDAPETPNEAEEKVAEEKVAEVREALAQYQGADFKEIENKCKKALRAGEFTVAFGNEILKEIR